jgi:hypothetical protein
MKEKTEQLITKWENKHSDLLQHYNLCSNISDYPAFVLLSQRTEMAIYLEFIEDLKKLRSKV